MFPRDLFLDLFSLADGIDLMGGSNGELQDLTNRVLDRAKECGMTVSK